MDCLRLYVIYQAIFAHLYELFMYLYIPFYSLTFLYLQRFSGSFKSAPRPFAMLIGSSLAESSELETISSLEVELIRAAILKTCSDFRPLTM